jgi:wax ester synthase-like acyl-CoA acyltransferase family protein
MDRPTNLMVVTCVFWFDRPLDWNRVAAAFAERLVPAFPRFAQRVVEPPVTLGLVGPRWADVERFDVRDHLRRVVLPAPGGDAELHAHVSAQADRPLDPDRPLWEAHLVDGFGDGWAILLRTHHAIADGTALVQALLALADPPGRWHPACRPAPARRAPLLRRADPGALPSLGRRRSPRADGTRASRRRPGRDAAPARVRPGRRAQRAARPAVGAQADDLVAGRAARIVVGGAVRRARFTVRVQGPRPDVSPEVEAAVRHYAGLRAGGAAGGLEELVARIEVVGDVEAAVTGAADPTGRGSRVLQGSSSASPPRHRRCAGATFP